MNDFTYYNPTRIVFGREAEKQAGALLRAAGARKVALHYGGQSAERSGLLAVLRESLQSEGVAWLELGGVRPNPCCESVRAYARICLEAGVDFILAVGGGSVIDSAKAIAVAAVSQGRDIWDVMCGRATVTTALPVGVVLTLAASGSESSPNFVLTDEATCEKRAFGAEYIRPKFALMNPERLLTLSSRQTACAVADILLHTMERYFTPSTDNLLTDALAEVSSARLSPRVANAWKRWTDTRPVVS